MLRIFLHVLVIALASAMKFETTYRNSPCEETPFCLHINENIMARPIVCLQCLHGITSSLSPNECYNI